MKKIISCLIFISFIGNVFGTAQVGELILYKGKKYPMFTLPLESYLPEDDARRELFRRATTFCHRGYIGIWKIESGFLYLDSINEGSDPEKNISLSKIFPDKKEPIKADWYTGVLRILQGERIDYDAVGIGFDLYFENELYIVIKKGRVTKEFLVDNKGSGATHSFEDYERILLAEKSIEDKGDWIDARLIEASAVEELKKTGDSFKTRGQFLFDKDEGIARLKIPYTPTTEGVEISLHSIPKEQKFADNTFVEIKAHFTKKDKDYLLDVESIRELRQGETIHHPDFRAPKENNDDEK